LQGTLLGCTIVPRRPHVPPAGLEAALFTSDDAGRPVGFGRTRAILQASADVACDALGLRPTDATFAAVPLYQGYGFDLALSVTLRAGATLVLEDEFNHRRTAKALREQEVTFCPGIPSMYEGLLQIAAAARPGRGARFLSGGSPLNPALAGRFHRAWGTRLWSCYHTTAAGLISLDARGQHPDSVGKPVPGVEVRTGDGRGDGPLSVRSGSVAPVVATLISGTTRVTVDGAGWLRTGDRGRVDRAGRVYLTGREDDLVKVDGRPVALGEVEACIVAFPKVAAARAEVENDRLGGAVVVAHVVSSCACAPEEIIDHCARNLASYKVPRRVRFVKEISA
jgi:acyl-CoA synthetase (AMP-forming)/AMP-acid ligase II